MTQYEQSSTTGHFRSSVTHSTDIIDSIWCNIVKNAKKSHIVDRKNSIIDKMKLFEKNKQEQKNVKTVNCQRNLLRSCLWNRAVKNSESMQNLLSD